jgi:hypothetical protein
MLREVGQSKTTQEHIQDWLELVEEDPGFEHLIEEEIAARIFSHLFSSALPVLLTFSFICFDRPCGLVVRVLGYRSGGPGSIPGTTKKK